MQILSAPFAAVVAGSYESIATTTVGSGGSSTVTFDNISGTYKHLQVRYIARNSGTGDNFIAMKWIFNSDATAVYSNHYIYGNGAFTGSNVTTSASSAGGDGLIGMIKDNAAGYTNMFHGGVLDILDYADTNKYKTCRLLWGQDLNGGGRVALQSANWQKTNAITQIDFSCATGNFMQYSQFALYGIKG
jgi:FlaG/FlaF family flagellin (archaellin)